MCQDRRDWYKIGIYFRDWYKIGRDFGKSVLLDSYISIICCQQSYVNINSFKKRRSRHEKYFKKCQLQ